MITIKKILITGGANFASVEDTFAFFYVSLIKALRPLRNNFASAVALCGFCL
jgi:hypothetical protein